MTHRLIGQCRNQPKVAVRGQSELSCLGLRTLRLSGDTYVHRIGRTVGLKAFHSTSDSFCLLSTAFSDGHCDVIAPLRLASA